MSLILLLVLMTLACYRITRLITIDTFPPVEWARRKIVQAERLPKWLGKLVTCYWCSSVWVAAGLTLLVALTVGLPLPCLVWPAIAAGSAWISHLEDYFDRGA